MKDLSERTLSPVTVATLSQDVHLAYVDSVTKGSVSF